MLETKFAGLLRLAALAVVLVITAILVAPLQLVARRRKWRLARTIPILFCRALCRCLNVRPHVRGTLAAGPVLLAPNHVSWLDIPALGCSEAVAFIAKREVAAWPILGSLARLQGAIFIDRSRRRHVPATNLRIAERMLARQSVVLFAEGTTGCGSRLNSFQTSHFEAARTALHLAPGLTQVAVQPVSIAYTRRNGMPLGRQGRPTIAWYGDMTLLPHLWGLVTSGPVDCEIAYGEPIPVTGASNRKQVGREAERRVRHATAMALTGRTACIASPSLASPVLIGAERS